MKSRPILEFIKGESFEGVKGMGSVEVIGNRKAIVESVTRIAEYENERVMLQCEKNILIINGKNLTIDSYSEKIIVVNGIIKNISFEQVFKC